MASAARFESTDDRYSWLSDIAAIWEGTFNFDKHRHLYAAHARATPL